MRGRDVRRERTAEIAYVDLRHHALALLLLNISQCLGLNATEPKGDTREAVADSHIKLSWPAYMPSPRLTLWRVVPHANRPSRGR
jgi:hypothetical protein